MKDRMREEKKDANDERKMEERQMKKRGRGKEDTEENKYRLEN